MKNEESLIDKAKEYEDEGNEEMAYRYYLECALSEGDPESLFKIGCMYLFGRYVNEDDDKAGHYFKLAHEAGEGDLPGYCYIIIAGCKEEQEVETWDSEMGWYRLAADNGCEHGYECIGYMYMQKGEYFKAIDYFDMAEKKTTISLYNLGKIYDEGLGVEKDMDKAIEYYKRTIMDCWVVKDHGDKFFAKAMARLEELGIVIDNLD